MASQPSRTDEERDSVPERRIWLRRALIGLAAGIPVAILGLWIAVNRVEWLGPYVADSLRAVVGTEAVTQLEDFAYGIQDRFNRVWRRGEKPKAYWTVPSTRPPAKAPAPAAAPTAKAEAASAPIPPFRPVDVGPALKSWSAAGDGVWVPMVDPRFPSAEPVMMKTLLHPDKNRSWAEVFVVAIDLRRVAVNLVPGTREPTANTLEAMELERPGVIPKADRDAAFAAFNGGFKTEHGSYGMRIGDITYVKPIDGVCAVAMFKDGALRVDNWNALAESEKKMTWWRQTPNCMVEDGKLHPRLSSELLAKRWGATLDGETVIRRSAIGTNVKGDILFVSITNHTTARVLAEGMRHVGALTVAQLDVNFSYPKFVTFEPKKDLDDDEEAKRIAIPLADGFEFSEDEFIRKPNRRDFFYLMPKDPDQRTAQNGGSPQN